MPASQRQHALDGVSLRQTNTLNFKPSEVMSLTARNIIHNHHPQSLFFKKVAAFRHTGDM